MTAIVRASACIERQRDTISCENLDGFDDLDPQLGKVGILAVPALASKTQFRSCLLKIVYRDLLSLIDIATCLNNQRIFNAEEASI